MHRRLATAMRGFAATLVVALLSCGAALAQEWPAKTVRAIVPLTAGSATDLIARAVLDQVASRLGQPIVVENRPGAGNTIGMAAAARSDPDGYTVLVNPRPASPGIPRGAAKPDSARAPRQARCRSDDPERGGVRQARARGSRAQHENRRSGRREGQLSGPRPA